MKHLLSISDVSRLEAVSILNTATELAKVSDTPMKKLPTLRGRTIVNLFAEDSTRPRLKPRRNVFQPMLLISRLKDQVSAKASHSKIRLKHCKPWVLMQSSFDMVHPELLPVWRSASGCLVQ
jgi:hypothetical protein